MPERVKVLSFDLGGTRYCVAADVVASVLAVSGSKKLASNDPWDAGTVTAAGERIRVIDLPRLFASSMRTVTPSDERKLLVFDRTDDDGHYYGWLVDEVDVTRTVQTAAIEPTRSAADTHYINGRLEVDDREVIWLDENAMHE